MSYQPNRYYGKVHDSQKSPVGYRNPIYGYADGNYFHLAYEPTSPKRVFAVFTAHLSQHESFGHVVIWLEKLFGKFFSEVMHSEVSRLDMCIDLYVLYDEIHKHITQHNVGRLEHWKSRTGEQSLYLGGKPRRSVVYEKKVHIANLDFIPEGCVPQADRYGYVDCVRIEVRTWGEKRLITKLADIEQLISINPFSHLKLEKIDEAILHSLTRKKKHSIDAYRFRCLEVGAQKAKAEFSEQGNFKKVIGDLLVPLEIQLHVAWKNRMRRFLRTI